MAGSAGPSSSPNITVEPAAMSHDAGGGAESPHRELESVPPNKCSYLIADHPYAVLLICLLVSLVCILLWIGVVNKGGGDGSSPGQTLAVDEIEVQRFLANQMAEKDRDDRVVSPRSLDADYLKFIVFSQHRGGPGNTILAPSVLRELYDFEQAFRGRPQQTYQYPRQVADYPANCQLDYVNGNGTTCRPPYSLFTQIFFRDKPATYTYADVASLTQPQIDALVKQYTTPEWLAKGHDFFFSKDFTTTNRSWATRTLFRFGAPVPGFQTFNFDNDEKQYSAHEKWVRQYTKFFKESRGTLPTLRNNYQQYVLSIAEIKDLVQGDLLLVTFAALSVFVLLVVHTESLFLGVFGLVNIILSYPVAMTIYHGVFQIRISPQLNLLALFVVLGIGADDVFVFTDAWKQALLESEAVTGSLAARGALTAMRRPTPPARVGYVRVRAETKLVSQSSRSERNYWFDEYKVLQEYLNSNASSASTANGMQTSPFWAYKATADAIVAATYQSIGLSYTVAVVALFLSSQNWIVASLASTTIMGVVFSILAFFVATGYKLGYLESLSATLLVGLAVDFTVHLSTSYNETQTVGRFYRARSALLEMGVSITGGAITTLMASFFLFFAQLLFFRVFGQFIFATVLLSYIWANAQFMPSLMLVGPTRHPHGDLQPLFRRLRYRLCGGDKP